MNGAAAALSLAGLSKEFGGLRAVDGVSLEVAPGERRAINGDVENREKFLEALKKVEIPDAPRGPLKLDAYGNPIQNIYIRKVEKKDGELWNTVIYTYPAVSQFWKYKPEEFLKQPVYDRNYPPCKHC